MNNLDDRVEDLEAQVEDLQLDLHASKVAITVLTTVINAMAGERGFLASSFEEGLKLAPPIKFDHPVPEDYEERLSKKVANLLSKAE